MTDLPEGYSVKAAELPEGYGVAKPPPTLDQRLQEVTGIDPTDPNRPAIIPLRENPNAKGETEWVMPQIGVDLIRSFLLPGHVLKGGTYNAQDAAKFTLDYLTPVDRLPSAGKQVSRQALTKNAPSTDEVLEKGGKLFEGLKGKGSQLPADDYLDFLAKVETRMDDLGIDRDARDLSPKLIAALDSMYKRLGRDIDYGRLHNIRRQLGSAAGSADSFERKAASEAIDMLDDVVERVLQEPKHREALNLWHMGKKAQTIEEVVRKAQFQASGFENGVRIGFRQLLRDPKKLRGFTPDEIKIMEEIEAGAPLTKVLRFAGTLGPKRSGDANMLRTIAGAAIGGASGIPGGELAVPMAGMAAGRAAEGATLNAAEYLRALAVSGGHIAPPTNQVAATTRLAEMLAGPTAATQLPVITQPKSDQDRLAEMLAQGRL